MKITKRKLDEIRRCYCAASIHMNHENHIIYASEDPDVMCEMFSGKSFEHKETIWKRPGLHVHHSDSQSGGGVSGSAGILPQGIPISLQNRVGEIYRERLCYKGCITAAVYSPL